MRREELAKHVVDAVWDARHAARMERREPSAVLLRQDVYDVLRRFMREEAIFGIPVQVSPGQISAVVVQ